VEVVASLSQGRTAAAQCNFLHTNQSRSYLNHRVMLLSLCGFLANRSREGCNFFGGGLKEVHVMLLVIVNHESFNIQKVKKRYA